MENNYNKIIFRSIYFKPNIIMLNNKDKCQSHNLTHKLTKKQNLQFVML